MLLAAAIAAVLAPQKPNVVLFLVDDLGWQDTSLKLGLPDKVVGRHFRTPNLERLALRGVQFTQAYASCPVCTPTRVALLTGVNPGRNHITNWVHSGQDTDGPHPDLVLPDWNKSGFQPGDAKTLPEAFREAGYRTVQIGKAHFGAAGTAGADPKNLGFDISIAGSAAGHPSSYYGLDNFAAKKNSPSDRPAHNDVPDLHAYHGKDVFLEEALASEGAKVIRQAAKDRKPLFLWYSPYAVHTPLMANKRLLKPYLGLDQREQAYATLVESVDNALGELERALRQSGQFENTVVIFTSDNGGLSQSSRGGPPNLHNLPLRSGKGSAYEGGTRVPLVVAGPGIARGVTLSETLATSTDLFSTIAELAGLKLAPQDGRSVAPSVKNGKEAPERDPILWHYPHHRGWGGPGLEPFTSLRRGDFKAIFFYAKRNWELYNLKNDIGETRDLSMTQPAKLKEMAQLMLSELSRMGAQLPVDAKSGAAIEPRIP